MSKLSLRLVICAAGIVVGEFVAKVALIIFRALA